MQMSATLLIRALSWRWTDVSLNSFQRIQREENKKRQFPLPWCVLEREAEAKISSSAEVAFWKKELTSIQPWKYRQIALWGLENHSGMWILHVQKHISTAAQRKALTSLKVTGFRIHGSLRLLGTFTSSLVCVLSSLTLILEMHPNPIYPLLHQLHKEEEQLIGTGLGARDKEPKHFYRPSFMSLLKASSSVKAIAKRSGDEAKTATAIIFLVNATPI